MDIDPGTMKRRMLCYEALRWVGTTELGGENRGQLVEIFQKAVDGRASGEPWCMAFTQFCAKQIDQQYDYINQASSGLRSCLYPSEHVLTTWNNTPKEARLLAPQAGTLILWQWYKNGKATASGHVGIVTEVIDDELVRTVEGNTSNPDDKIVREGDGVFSKRRKFKDDKGSFRVLGFLDIWRTLNSISIT